MNDRMQTVTDELDARGWAVVPRALSEVQCEALILRYPDDSIFRSTVHMAQHGFGRGEYKYFSYPLLEPLADLRAAFYRHLAPIANRWHAEMGLPLQFPPELADYLAACHAAGQTRPTPLLLQYGKGDWNALHQDLYGAHIFPLQVVVLLSAPREHFLGGEFILTETRPRAQSRAHVVPLFRGDAVIFASAQRPERLADGTGWYRVAMKHGVSEVTGGSRHTLGFVFHDAK
jgi:hypothetical protein